MNKKGIYNEVSQELQRIVNWTKSDIEKEYCIDTFFFVLFKKYDIKSDYGIIGPLYSFLDVFCDSFYHGFKEVTNGYSFDEAIKDINYLIESIDNDMIDKIEHDYLLINKFKSI
jgi:hypothetical protein